MKKIYLALIIVLSLMFVACNKLESTDLNNIKIDNMVLGQVIDTVDLSKYEPTDKYDNDYNYNFEELQIKTNDNDSIEKIWLLIYEYDFLSINKENKFKNIEQITTVLGSDYKEYWYDKEQGLKSHEYVDSKTKTKINFVYSDFSDQPKKLVWVILESI